MTGTDSLFSRSIVSTLDGAEVDGDGHTVTVRLVRWNDARPVVDPGRPTPYSETFARGGLIPPAAGELPVYVEREHNGPVVGVITDFDDRPDGLYGTVRVSRSAAGRDMVADIADRIYRYVSVDFCDRPVARTTTAVTRTAARLRRLAFTLEPAHDAPVIAMRSQTPNPENPNPQLESETITVDTDADTDTDTDTTTAPAPTPAPVPAAAHDAPAAPEVIATRSAPAIDNRAPIARPAAGTGAPRFATFGHFVRSAGLGEINGDELAVFARALADVTTTDAPGLIQEQWIGEVIDLARQYTPTVNAWRSRPLPTSGMSISQPVVELRPTVDEQTTQKTEVTTTDITIGVAQWVIKTYAGGNDVALQLIARSDPDFLNEMFRLYMRELAQKINTAAATALTAAAAVGVSGNTALEFTTGAAFDELVIDASGVFLTAATLLRPVEVIAMSVDLWKAVGKAKDLDGRPLYPAVNPMNASGTFDARGVDGNVSGISWYVEPALGAGIKGVMGVREAFVSALGPVNTLTAAVPAKIGRDVAVYQEAAFGASDATGLVQIVNVTP